MKVIAKAAAEKYLCEVSHQELEKFLGKYYGKLDRLDVGHEVNLGQGYDYSVRIEGACQQMTVAMTEFERAQQVMTSFAIAIAKSSGQEGGAA